MSERASQESSGHVSDIIAQASINVGPIPQLERDFEKRARTPHLRNIFTKSPIQECFVSRYDYSSTWRVLDTEHLSIDCSPGNVNGCQRVVDRIMTDEVAHTTRLVIVEDICSNMIRLLCEYPGVEVEFFEQHLINCGWRGSEVPVCLVFEPLRAVSRSSHARRNT